jgi:lipid-binding SYLF domain-containing protein
VALKGSVITVDDSANQKVYGSGVSGKNILLGNEVAPTSVVQPFLEALQTYDPARRKSAKAE